MSAPPGLVGGSEVLRPARGPGALAAARRVAAPIGLRGFALAVAALSLIPAGFVVVATITTGWDEAWELLVRRRVADLMSNTVRLTVGTLGCCAVLGIAAAWLVERTTLPFARAWNALLAAPLAIPAFVNSFGWVSLTYRVEGYGGAVLITTLSYYPFVYLPVAAALRGLDPSHEESGRALGDGPLRTFRRVVLPQLRPALGGGLLLVALHLLAEFGALQMLRFPTFTTAIYEQYRSTFNGTAANMLAAVLAVLCVAVLTIEVLSRGRARYARIGSGAARPAPRARLGRATPVVLAGLGALVGLALGVPLFSLGHWLVEGSSTSFPVGDLTSAALSSILLGAVGALVTVVLAFPVAWLAVRRPGVVSTVTERSTYLGHALPGIIVALSLVTVTIRWSRPLYQSTTLLIAAYAISFFPLALVALRASLLQAPTVLDDSARALGARPMTVLRRITLPLAAPGIGVGMGLVFLAVVNELTATLLLAPIGTDTLATRFWASASEIAYGAAAPYAALMVLISLPATVVLTRAQSAPRGT